MSWNYRAVRTYHRVGSADPPEYEASVAVHEVYYDAKGKPNGYTAEPAWPSGDTWEQFVEDFGRYLNALNGPSHILDQVKDFGEPLDREPGGASADRKEPT